MFELSKCKVLGQHGGKLTFAKCLRGLTDTPLERWHAAPHTIRGAVMRCHFMSDLHLEAQSGPERLPGGDVLIIAGDLCHASALSQARTDKYAVAQRDRVFRVMDEARAKWARVLMVTGNHEHYDGIFEDTVPALRRELGGVTVLDDEAVEIDGVQFFGGTLWSDFEGRSAACLDRVRKRMGEYFFVRTSAGSGTPRKFRPEDALAAHDRCLSRLRSEAEGAGNRKIVVISHHAPTLRGLNPAHAGNGLDGCFASNLDALIESLPQITTWVHGHTHIRRKYRIGETMLLANCCGFKGKDASSAGFSPDVWFEA